MARHRNNGYFADEMEFILIESESEDVVDAVPLFKREPFHWDEIIYSREVLDKALNKIPVIDEFKDIDPLGLGLPIFSYINYEAQNAVK